MTAKESNKFQPQNHKRYSLFMLDHKVQSHFKDVNAYKLETVQSLWSGYGEISRYYVPSIKQRIIAKCVDLQATNKEHPRGWNTPISHQRKLSSYYNEQRFYEDFSTYTNSHCTLPKCYASGNNDQSIWLILEDLDESGYSARAMQGNDNVAQLALSWLANFHSCFLQNTPLSPNISSLWSRGTYWHFKTRPDEFATMPNSKLKDSASLIDEQLNQATYQTLLHGDAKLTNFCFSEDNNKESRKIAALDFQYVGQGVGTQDVAYLLGACYFDDLLFSQSDKLLDYYFDCLHKANQKNKVQVDSLALEKEWRQLYSFAWADFERFLQGWSPGHKKLTKYSSQQVNLALNQLDNQS